MTTIRSITQRISSALSRLSCTVTCWRGYRGKTVQRDGTILFHIASSQIRALPARDFRFNLTQAHVDGELSKAACLRLQHEYAKIHLGE